MKKLVLKPSVKRKFQNLDIIVFLGPYLAVFFMFTILPVIISYFIAFTNFNTMDFPEWVGLENYRRLFLEEEYFTMALQTSLVLAAISGPLNYIVAFACSWCLNEIPSRIRTILTMFFYIPALSGGFTFITDLLFSSDRYGFVNSFLLRLNLIDDPIQWAVDTDVMIPLCIVIMLWNALGQQFLIFLSSLQSIDRSLYEAAAVDGVSNRWQELYYVTLPSIKGQLILNAILTITSSMTMVIPTLFGSPTQDYKLYTLTMLQNDYTARMEMGYVSAVASIVLLISVLLNKLITFLISKVGT